MLHRQQKDYTDPNQAGVVFVPKNIAITLSHLRIVKRDNTLNFFHNLYFCIPYVNIVLYVKKISV